MPATGFISASKPANHQLEITTTSTARQLGSYFFTKYFDWQIVSCENGKIERCSSFYLVVQDFFRMVNYGQVKTDKREIDVLDRGIAL